MRKAIRLFVIVLLIVLSILSTGGGWMLIDDPTGESMQFQIDLLKNTPFNNYFIPGIILFISVGMLSLFIALLVIFKKKGYAKLVILEGIILIGWLSIELILNVNFYVAVLHIPLYIIGILLMLAGFILLKRKTEHNNVHS